MKNNILLFLFVALNLSLFINTIGYSQTDDEEEEECELIFDFGVGEDTYCDSSLVEMGFFHYGIVDGNRVKSTNFIDSQIEDFEDDLIRIKVMSGSFKVKRKFDQVFKNYNLSKLFFKGRKFEYGYRFIVYKMYSYKIGTRIYYLFFIRPETTNSSRNQYRPILIDVNNNSIDVIPFPGYQSSTSLQCLRFLEYDNSFFYISYDLFSVINKFSPSVCLYKFNKFEFVKVSDFVLKLKTGESNFYPLYLINYNKSNLIPLRFAK